MSKQFSIGNRQFSIRHPRSSRGSRRLDSRRSLLSTTIGGGNDRFKVWLLSLVISVIFGFGTLNVAVAPAASAATVSAAEILNQACTGEAAQSAVCKSAAQTGTNNPISGKQGILAKVSRVLGYIIGIGSVIVLVVGGLNYVTAAGNAEKSAKAKARITYAVVGLLVALLSWTIAAFFTHRLL